MLVDLILINYRSRSRIQALLEQHGSTLSHSRFQPFVVNNDPGDDTMITASARLACRLVVNRENRGFGAAVNQAARLGFAPWILLVNPDVRVEPAALEAIPQVIEVARDVGALTGPNLEAGGPRSHGPFPTLREVFAPVPANPSPRGDVDWAAGSLLLLRRTSFEALGGFDEGYFMYYEDVDYCRRLRQRGERVVVDERLAHRHTGHGSYQGDEERQARDHRRGKARYLALHGHLLHRWLYRIFCSVVSPPS